MLMKFAVDHVMFFDKINYAMKALKIRVEERGNTYTGSLAAYSSDGAYSTIFRSRPTFAARFKICQRLYMLKKWQVGHR